MVAGSTLRLRVLIVDDSPFLRRVIHLLLDESGRFEVIGEAADRWEGVYLTRTLNPDVITLDWHMPLLDGREMLKRLRRESDVPVVMVSSLPPGVDTQGVDSDLLSVDLVVKEFSDHPLDLSVFADEPTKKLVNNWETAQRRKGISSF
jgi:two-component system, chemotaxis family, protein-glutamate methylesterase/glutaminase